MNKQQNRSSQIIIHTRLAGARAHTHTHTHTHTHVINGVACFFTFISTKEICLQVYSVKHKLLQWRHEIKNTKYILQ